MNLAAVLQWLDIAQQIEAKGEGVWTAIKAVLVDHGIEADTAALDAAIADAARRKALAEHEAAGPLADSPSA